MPAPQESKTFYIRAPSLEYREGGPIRLGNVIRDIFNPEDPVDVLDPLPEIIDGIESTNNTIERGASASMNLSLAAKVYEAFGANVAAGAGRATHAVYTADRLRSRYFATNPTVKDAKALFTKSAEVAASIKRGPVYIVTGLKIAEGLKYAASDSAARTAGAGSNARISDQVQVEAAVDGAKERNNAVGHTLLGDVILAYRLHIVKEVGFTWRRDYKVGRYDPGNAGFLDFGKTSKEMEMDVEQLSENDLEGFIDENEYEGIREIGFWDEDASRTLICIER